jgi:hypothetical protein
MQLKLDLHELVELCTYDNRRLSVKCTRSVDGVPVLDLLPRVRYLLRASASAEKPRGLLFFARGLIVIPEESASASELRVAVLNMSEKAVRVGAGSELGDDDGPLQNASAVIQRLPHSGTSGEQRRHGTART